MPRPYDDIPRQGVHRTDRLDTEPTTNVHAQEPVHPVERSKETRAAHVLLENASDGAYRLRVMELDAIPEDPGFREIDRVPEAGDVGRLYDRIPEAARHAVFEHSRNGSVYYEPDARLSGDWTRDELFDRVTIFTDMDDAKTFADERREKASDE